MAVSIGLGTAIGLAYAVSAYVTLQRAAKHEGSTFMMFFLGGLFARMIGLLLLVGLVIVLVEIEPVVFLVPLVVLLLGTVVYEVFAGMRLAEASQSSGAAG